MKTHTYGSYSYRHFEWGTERRIREGEYAFLASLGLRDYVERRSNGAETDSPTAEFPEWREIPLSAYSWVWTDGRLLAYVTWYNKVHGYFSIPDAAKYPNKDGYWEVTLRLDETPEMRGWMEQRDVNYLTRLAREGRLYEQEPRWESEVSEWVLTEATKDSTVIEVMATHGSPHPAARAPSGRTPTR